MHIYSVCVLYPLLCSKINYFTTCLLYILSPITIRLFYPALVSLKFSNNVVSYLSIKSILYNNVIKTIFLSYATYHLNINFQTRIFGHTVPATVFTRYNKSSLNTVRCLRKDFSVQFHDKRLNFTKGIVDVTILLSRPREDN